MQCLLWAINFYHILNYLTKVYFLCLFSKPQKTCKLNVPKIYKTAVSYRDICKIETSYPAICNVANSYHAFANKHLFILKSVRQWFFVVQFARSHFAIVQFRMCQVTIAQFARQKFPVVQLARQEFSIVQKFVKIAKKVVKIYGTQIWNTVRNFITFFTKYLFYITILLFHIIILSCKEIILSFKGNAQFLFLCNPQKSGASRVCITFPQITQKILT